MSLKVALITGTYPPEKCGVGDYSSKLIHAQNANFWRLFYYKDWSFSSVIRKIREIAKSDEDILNIQYPSMGFGYSLVPHFLCFYFSLFSKKHVTVTIHEYTRLGRKSRLAAIVFLIFSQKIIFTNEFERKAAIKRIPWIKKKSKVIKILSNITPAFEHVPTEKRTFDLGCFGLLTPKKGIEEFLEVSTKILQLKPSIEIFIMGQTLDKYKDFSDKVMNEANKIGVKLFLNKDEKDVSAILSNTKICYLPFPDGVSERRGSFLASVLNYCMIYTTEGIYTTEAHKEFCYFVEKEDAADSIVKALNQTEEYYQSAQLKTEKFIKNHLPKSWEDVIEQYHDVFQMKK